jgi:hypothetical protein
MAVNQELIKLHWWIGAEIVKRQETEGWKLSRPSSKNTY